MPETRVYKVINDCAIKLDVYPAQGSAPTPVLVWIHGGALITGGRGSMPLVLQKLCTRAGLTQVAIDYRLAPETKLPAILEDLVDAVRWIRDQGARHFNIDPDRLSVMGHSAGGYLSLMSGFHVEPHPRALVSLSGYGDIVGDWYTRPDDFYCRQPSVPAAEAYAAVGRRALSEVEVRHQRERFYLYCRQQGRWPQEVVGMDPAQNLRAFDAYRPVVNVGPSYPPTLLVHGTADTDVPYQLSIDMSAALERAGVSHELVLVPEGGHRAALTVTCTELEADPPPVAAQALLKVVEFLARSLKGDRVAGCDSARL